MSYEGRDLEAMSFAPNYHRWIRDELGKAIHGEIAEVGAGTGSFSRLLHEVSAGSLTLFEPDPGMFEHLRAGTSDLPRVRQICASFTESALAFRGAFDTMVYNNVLEHIEDDAREVALARDALRPGGHLCIFVPALPMLMSDFDRQIGHFRRYRRKPLCEMLENAGFVVERADYVDVAGIVPWFVAMRLLRGGLNPSAVAAYDKLVVPIARRVESWVRPPLGKNLLAIARWDG